MNKRTVAITEFVNALFDKENVALRVAFTAMFKLDTPDNVPLVPFMVEIASDYRHRLIMVLLESGIEAEDAEILKASLGTLLKLVAVMHGPAFSESYNQLFKGPIEADLRRLAEGAEEILGQDD